MPELTAPQAVDRTAVVAARPRIASAARWFWWIAGLSVVNSVMVATGSHTSFLAGLGITQLADGFFHAFPPAAYALDLAVVGFFVAMGFVARRGYRWAFVVGGVAYALDALIFLPFGAYLPIAFHLWALFFITNGGLKLHRAIGAQQAQAAASTAPAFRTPVEPPPLN